MKEAIFSQLKSLKTLSLLFLIILWIYFHGMNIIYRPVGICLQENLAYTQWNHTLTYNHTLHHEGDCWEQFYSKHFGEKSAHQMALITMCALSPIYAEEPTLVFAEGVPMTAEPNFTVLHIGVHEGPTADGKVNAPQTGIKFISWHKHDKAYASWIRDILNRAYNPEHTAQLQREFWSLFWNNPHLQ